MFVLLASGCALHIKTVEQVAEKPPDTYKDTYKSDGSYYYYVESQLQRIMGNPDNAVLYLRKAIERDPDSLYLRRELANLYFASKEKEKALSVIEEALEKDPENIATLIMYGRIKQDLKHIDDAEKAYEKVIAADPKQENTYLLLGGLYIEEGKLTEALQVYERLIENFPG
ncbi:MAG: tetratricopeptide repeat protein, partial [Desulfobacterales bacterium]|nr:tetratricopeptide repeat protein [Desulfobacterales bacterium]